MHETSKNVSVSYDGIAKSLLDTLDDANIIRFINYTFSRKYTSDATVTRMATETTSSNLKQKRCDYFIRINDELFLIEIQSRFDGKMAMRLFEYSIRGAKLHGKSIDDNDVVKLNVPNPVVFYLRKSSKPLGKLTVQLSNKSGESFEFKADVIYLHDCSFSDMIDKYMYPMMPFYSMRYEQILLSRHTEKDEKKILSDLLNCNKQLKESYSKKIISGEIFQYIREWLVNVFCAIVDKAKSRNRMINYKEAYKVMQMIMNETIEGFDIFKALRDSKAEGREEGRKEGEAILLFTLSGLVSDGILTVAQAAERANMTVEEFKEKAGIE